MVSPLRPIAPSSSFSNGNRHETRGWSLDQLRQHQWDRLGSVWKNATEENLFFRSRLAGYTLGSWDEWDRIPTISKGDLVDPNDPMGRSRNHTWGNLRYTRFHRTSGTLGQPLVVQDTEEDWAWWIQTWQYVLDAAQVEQNDRVFMAFSFGPFIGFWSAHDACLKRGAMIIPGGGLSTMARLDLIRTSEATVVCCTPSYALHMAHVASEQGVDLRENQVRQIIVAGEPGGSVPSVRDRIQTSWNAIVTDHSGGTEVGPWGVGTPEGDSLHVIESEFLAEFIPFRDGSVQEVLPQRDIASTSLPDGLAELVLTPLGRFGSPLIRYRTGDLVRPVRDSRSPFVRLQGGVLGRVDDMMIIRGVNVFPSSIEAILHSFPDISEFRIIATKSGALDQLEVEVEDRLNQPNRIAERIQVQLGLRVEVTVVSENSLPRQEGKARRFVDRRRKP